MLFDFLPVPRSRWYTFFFSFSFVLTVCTHTSRFLLFLSSLSPNLSHFVRLSIKCRVCHGAIRLNVSYPLPPSFTLLRTTSSFALSLCHSFTLSLIHSLPLSVPKNNPNSLGHEGNAWNIVDLSRRR